MIKHLLKLAWNRRRTNIPIMVEIALSFLVLVFVATLCADGIDNYRRPLGFAYENVWHISMSRVQRLTPTSTTEDSAAVRQGDLAAVRQVYLMLRDSGEIEAVGSTYSVPFVGGDRGSYVMYDGRRVSLSYSRATDEVKDVLGLQIVRGRWFEGADNALNWEPVVITQKLARELFDAEEPLGRKITPDSPQGADWRVVGVISEYRPREFDPPHNVLFIRANWHSDVMLVRSTHTSYLIKVRNGTTAAFEEKLMAKLRAIGRGWTFEITPLSQLRMSGLKDLLSILTVIVTVGAFLMIMVGLGLMGILWQNVTQRTKEIGLRRASGATDGDIYRQILGELLVMTSVGVVTMAALLIQFPLFEVIGFVTSWRIYLSGLAISGLLMYGLVILCGLYPCWLVTRVHPSEALHYE